MRVIDRLEGAMALSLKSQEEVHSRWVKVQFPFSAIAGVAALGPFAGNTRLDMLLRQIEAEQLAAGIGSGSKIDLVADLAMNLAEAWVIRSYELVRVAVEQNKKRGDAPIPKLSALHDRLALVRMPIAKAEIKSANRHKGLRIVLSTLLGQGDVKVSEYAADGSYSMPKGICGQTGAAMWWPIDIETGQNVEVCRRDLSDEFLALFD